MSKGSGKKDRKWQIVCIERLVINDSAHANQGPQLSDFGNDILPKRRRYGIQTVRHNCWERELSLRLKRCLVNMDRSEAVRHNDLCRIVNKKRAGRSANCEGKRAIIRSITRTGTIRKVSHKLRLFFFLYWCISKYNIPDVSPNNEQIFFQLVAKWEGYWFVLITSFMVCAVVLKSIPSYKKANNGSTSKWWLMNSLDYGTSR